MKKKENVNYEPIPDEVYKEAQYDDAIHLVGDHFLVRAQATLNARIIHYGHNVDVTEFPFYCSDCQVVIDGK